MIDNITLEDLRQAAANDGVSETTVYIGGPGWPAIAALIATIDDLADALRPIIHEYNLWSEGADDGEFRLWDLDRLVAAILAARAALDRQEQPDA